MHDVVRQAKGGGQPIHGHVAVLCDVIGLEWHLDLQHVGISGQHFPRSVDLEEISLSIIGLLTGVTPRKGKTA